VLQCVSVSYSYALQIVLFVLQRVAVYCHSGTLQIKHHLTLIFDITATRCNTLQHTATHYKTLQHTLQNTLQLTATHFQATNNYRAYDLRMGDMSQRKNHKLQLIATHCNLLQLTATRNYKNYLHTIKLTFESVDRRRHFFI